MYLALTSCMYIRPLLKAARVHTDGDEETPPSLAVIRWLHMEGQLDAVNGTFQLRVEESTTSPECLPGSAQERSDAVRNGTMHGRIRSLFPASTFH